MIDTIITLFLLSWPFLVALPIAGVIVWLWQCWDNWKKRRLSVPMNGRK